MRRLFIVPVVLLFSSCIIGPPNDQPVSGLPYSFEKVPLEGDFATLTDFKFLPNSTEFLAVSRIGKVGYFRLSKSKAVLVASFTIPDVEVEGDCGASSLQLDPYFKDNDLFYVGYCTSMQDNTVSRFTFDNQYFNAVLLSQREVISTQESRAVRPVHGVGSINFDNEGAMLIHFGEKGITTNAQDIRSPLGKIIRLLPNRDPEGSGYDIPGDNPFLEGESNPLVYAYGFRNPWRGVYGPSGTYWIAEVGSSKFEEINILKPGANYGWPKSEGVCEEQCDGIIDPVISYDHTAEHAYVQEDPAATTSKFRTVWICSGYDARLSGTDPYQGALKYDLIFGDMFAGWVRGAALDADGALSENNMLGHLPFVTSCQQGRDGYLYMGTMFTANKVDQDGNPAFNDPSELNGALWRMVMPASPVDEIE